MKRVHIVGSKNHGKTTLVVELVRELTLRGLRVGTIKHTHHRHELDTPGKDSHRHRTAGAAVVGILTRSGGAVFWDKADDSPSDSEERYDVFEPNFANCDLVLVEGDSRSAAMRIEVWRACENTLPLAHSDDQIVAVVTDDKVEVQQPVWQRSDISAITTEILRDLS